MNKNSVIYFILTFVLAGSITISFYMASKNDDINKNKMNHSEEIIKLPEPDEYGTISVEEAIEKRRSVRSFQDKEISLDDVSRLLWAAQGITHEERGLRSSPSAGATYPLEIYLVVGRVESVDAGVYRYLPEKNSLELVLENDVRKNLQKAALGQDFISEAPISIVISGIYERTTSVYGERGEMYVHMEVGHAAQNIYLQCESLSLGTVVVGAFEDERVKEVLALSENKKPFYVLPIGKQR